MTTTEPAGRAAQEEQPDLPPRLAAVLDNLEEAAAAHDGELDVLSPITPLPADDDEPPSLTDRDSAPSG
ncbi:MAG TPA: hypothetical protein VGQ05_04670 [Streptosporangiaceae bacterium]|jgi:hypothetical protein|nr:hypothetical protein [Streptosporangiaceae bacterium]